MNRRVVFIGLVVVVVAAIAGAIYLRRTAQQAAGSAAAERSGTVETGAIEVWVSTTGDIAPVARASLGFGVTGLVGQVPVKVGDRVQAGDVLLELDPRSLDSSLISAQADLLDAQKALEDLHTLPTSLELAQAEEAVLDAQEALEDAQRHVDGIKHPDVAAYQETLDDAFVTLESAQSEQTITEVSGEAGAVQAAQDGVERAAEQLGAVQSAEAGCGNCDPNRMANAQDAYNGALNALTAAQLNLQNAQAAEQQTARDAQEAVDEAAERLAAAQAGPRLSEVALAEAELATAQGQYDQAVQDLADLKAGPDDEDVAAAEVRVAAAESRVNQVRLIAPFDGTVTSIAYGLGDTVVPNQTAVVVADLDRLHVDALVDELDIAEINQGQTVELTLDALPDASLAGQVTSIDQSPVEGATTTQYPVRIELSPVDVPVRIGMTAAVNILVAHKEGVLLVPNWALRLDSETGQTVVTVRRGLSLVEVPVTLGLRSETHSEVVAGLEASDVVSVPVTPEPGNQGGPFGGGG